MLPALPAPLSPPPPRCHIIKRDSPKLVWHQIAKCFSPSASFQTFERTTTKQLSHFSSHNRLSDPICLFCWNTSLRCLFTLLGLFHSPQALTRRYLWHFEPPDVQCWPGGLRGLPKNNNMGHVKLTSGGTRHTLWTVAGKKALIPEPIYLCICWVACVFSLSSANLMQRSETTMQQYRSEWVTPSISVYTVTAAG